MLPSRGAQQTHDASRERGLARPALAHQPESLRLANGERDAGDRVDERVRATLKQRPDRGLDTIAHPDLLHFQDGAHATAPSGPGPTLAPAPSLAPGSAPAPLAAPAPSPAPVPLAAPAPALGPDLVPTPLSNPVAAPPPASAAKWHFARCPSASRTSGGARRPHTSTARGQRGAKMQPFDRATRSGTSPGIVGSARLLPAIRAGSH